MHRLKLWKAAPSLFLLFALTACTTSNTSSKPGEITAEQVQEKNQESLELTKAYANQEKEKAQKEIEAQLQELDRKIEELNKRTQEVTDQAQKTGSKVKSELDGNLESLKAQREAASADLNKLKQSTSEGWKVTAAKINKAVDELSASTQKLTQEASEAVKSKASSKEPEKSPKP